MAASHDPIEVRAVAIDLSPAVRGPRGWIDFRIILDSKPLGVPVRPGQNRALKIMGSFSAKAPASLAQVLKDALERHHPEMGISWRLTDTARRRLWNRPGYSREDVAALEAKIEGVICDTEAALA